MGDKRERASQARKIRVSNLALKNIDELTDFIAFTQQQPLNAIKVAEKIDKTIGKIAANPLAYKECEQLTTASKMYRQCVCMSWLIIYRIDKNEILILSIIHGARQLNKIRKLRKIK